MNKLQWNLYCNHTFPFTKIHLKMSSGKWRPSCLGLNVLNADQSAYKIHNHVITEWHNHADMQLMIHMIPCYVIATNPTNSTQTLYSLIWRLHSCMRMCGIFKAVHGSLLQFLKHHGIVDGRPWNPREFETVTSHHSVVFYGHLWIPFVIGGAIFRYTVMNWLKLIFLHIGRN